MSSSGGSQSIGGPGDQDGISGSDNSGTEGATSGAGVDAGVKREVTREATREAKQDVWQDANQGDATRGKSPPSKQQRSGPAQPANPTHGVGQNGAPGAGEQSGGA